MARVAETPFLPERLRELAARAEKLDRTVFTPFLTPPEAQAACATARKVGVAITLFGGYPNAERQMAGFSPQGQPCEAFPMVALSIAWPRQNEPSHRDLLGSVMALGVQRQALGDIVLMPEQAYLFVQAAMAQHIAESWTQASKTVLRVAMEQELPEIAGATGNEMRFTVASLRLDAVVAGGFHLSRGKAEELIEAGNVKLRYVPVLRGDARVGKGDMISARGLGRLQIADEGMPTRKGRLPITVIRFGDLKHR